MLLYYIIIDINVHHSMTNQIQMMMILSPVGNFDITITGKVRLGYIYNL